MRHAPVRSEDAPGGGQQCESPAGPLPLDPPQMGLCPCHHGKNTAYLVFLKIQCFQNVQLEASLGLILEI